MLPSTARVLRLAGALLLSQAVATGFAWACSCAPLSLQAVADSRDPLLVGEVVRTRRQLGCSSLTQVKVVVEVEEDLRGKTPPGERVVLTTAVSGASCGLGDDLVPGQRWLLNPGDSGGLGLCGASHRLPATGDSELLTALRGALEGELRDTGAR